MELWILSGLVLAAAAICVATRLRRRHRQTGADEAKNIYPLW